jgi:hypothetical protein
MEEKKKEVSLFVNTGTVIGSTFSQIARVTVTDAEATLEFAYVHPSDPTQGQSVARVTMPIESALGLAETILQVQRIQKKRKEGKKND